MAVDLRGSAVRRYAPPACLARVSDALRYQCTAQRNGVVVVVSPNGLHSRKVVLQLLFGCVSFAVQWLTLSKSGVATKSPFAFCFIM